MYIILSLVLSMACGFIFIPQILKTCKNLQLYDKPNERKVHKANIPRLGGLSFLPSMAAAVILAMAVYFYTTGREVIVISSWSCYFLIGAIIIYAVGVFDDINELKPLTKFFWQIVAACMIPASGLWINNLYGIFGIYEIPFWLGAPITVFVIVFINNAINLIDGIDGLSSGLSLIALTGFLWVFYNKNMMIYSMLISGMIGILIAYMYFNIFGKAEKNRKIFMGDSGSLTLGYVLGFLLVETSMDMGDQRLFVSNPLLTSFSLIAVPVFDVVRVILIRLRTHKAIFGADKNHIHHKMLYLGFTQHQALLLILTMALCYIALNALLMNEDIDSTLIVVIDVAIYVAFNLFASHVKRVRIRKGLEPMEEPTPQINLEQEETEPSKTTTTVA